MAQREPRTAHPYYMYDMITQQPKAIERVISEERSTIKEFAKKLHAVGPIYIVGIGTSWHATLVGEYLFRLLADRHDVKAIHSFDFASFPPTLNASTAVIILSHRGTKQYSLQALEHARAAGSVTGILTSVGSAARVDLCDFVIRTSVPEMSSAFTVSHTCAMTALMLLALEVGLLNATPNAAAVDLNLRVDILPKIVTEVLKSQEEPVKNWVQQAKDRANFFFIAYGINVSNCYEVSLKIKEACYLSTEGFQIEQFLHGPMCGTNATTMVTVLDHKTTGEPHTRAHQIAGGVLDIGAKVCVISPEVVNKEDCTSITLPQVEEAFAPIVYLLPLQLFTYWMALEKTEDPDVFRKNNPLYAAAFSKITL